MTRIPDDPSKGLNPSPPADPVEVARPVSPGAPEGHVSPAETGAKVPPADGDGGESVYLPARPAMPVSDIRQSIITGPLAHQSAPPQQTADLAFLSESPPWSALSAFSWIDQAPYRELYEITLRNERLLERYRAKIISSLAPHLGGLIERHRQNILEAKFLHAYPDESYRHDLYDRTLILQSRILDLGRQLGEEMEKASRSLPSLSEVARPKFPPGRYVMEPEAVRPGRGERGYPALVNHRYPGIAIRIRSYQIEALRAWESDLSRVEHLGGDPEDLEGTIVMPTGSGKTRLMSAAMAIKIARGEFKHGDKFIVTTHLKTLTRQNLDEIRETLSADFKRYMGRELKITAVAGDDEDYSGDVIVASIPKVGRSDYDFRSKLSASLSEGSQVVMAMMDEIHHKDTAESWKGVEADIREVSPKVYVLGLTATPRGSEKNLIYKKTPLEFFRAGVLPNVHVVEVPSGRHVDGIRTAGGDFVPEELSSVIDEPVRNLLVAQKLEKFGFRSAENDNALAPTLIRASSIRHAWNLSGAYAAHFGKGGHPGSRLRGRRITVTGIKEEGGDLKIVRKSDIEAALAAKERGEADAIVCVITGGMREDVRRLVMENWREGKIEAVIYAEVFREGLDAWWAQNLVGASATLSAENKAQEAGRITRRGRDEYDERTGRILKHRPRVAIDIRDIYTKGHLYSYRESFGYWYRVIPAETPWNMVADAPADGSKPEPIIPPPRTAVAEIDEGESEDERESAPLRIEPPALKWHMVIAALNERLAKNYGGDAAEMAFDLGMDPEEAARILESQNVLDVDLDLIQRMATLLYSARGELTSVYLDEIAAEASAKEYAVIEVLKLAIQRYCHENKIPFGAPFKIKTGTPAAEIDVARSTLEQLFKNSFLKRGFWQIARGLVDYFSARDPDMARRIITAMNRAYGGRLAWDRRIAVFRDFSIENLLSEHPELVANLRSGAAVYLNGSYGWKVANEDKIVGAMNFSASLPPKTQCAGFIGLSLHDGRLKVCACGGRRAEGLAEAIRKLDPDNWTAALHLARCASLSELAGLLEEMPCLLAQVAEEQFARRERGPYYLSGSCTASILRNGTIYGALSVTDKKPETGAPFLPYIKFRLRGDRVVIMETAGGNVYLLEQVLKGEQPVAREITKRKRPYFDYLFGILRHFLFLSAQPEHLPLLKEARGGFRIARKRWSEISKLLGLIQQDKKWQRIVRGNPAYGFLLNAVETMLNPRTEADLQPALADAIRSYLDDLGLCSAAAEKISKEIETSGDAMDFSPAYPAGVAGEAYDSPAGFEAASPGGPELDNFELSRAVADALAKLSSRQQAVLRRTVMDEQTLKEAGDEFEVTRERIRQIGAKALRRIRHSSQSKHLKPFLTGKPPAGSASIPPVLLKPSDLVAGRFGRDDFRLAGARAISRLWEQAGRTPGTIRSIEAWQVITEIGENSAMGNEAQFKGRRLGDVKQLFLLKDGEADPGLCVHARKHLCSVLAVPSLKRRGALDEGRMANTIAEYLDWRQYSKGETNIHRTSGHYWKLLRCLKLALWLGVGPAQRDDIGSITGRVFGSSAPVQMKELAHLLLWVETLGPPRDSFYLALNRDNGGSVTGGGGQVGGSRSAAFVGFPTMDPVPGGLMTLAPAAFVPIAVFPTALAPWHL